MQKCIWIFAFLVMAGGAMAQVPEVGKLVPDFTLSHITHFKSTKASAQDFRGKWLFLDFWTTHCVVCIQSFPKVNTYYKEFSDRLNWMMVGVNDRAHNARIVEVYEKLAASKNLEMPSAYDSVLAKQWDVPSYPHIVIIDPEGVVRAITDGRDMTAKKISDLLEGKDVKFFPKNRKYIEFDPDYTPADEHLLFRSSISKWNGERQYYLDMQDWLRWPEIERKKGYYCTMLNLRTLYNVAYFGVDNWMFVADDSALHVTVFPHPVLEIKDSSLFAYDYNSIEGKGLYNYSMFMPEAELSLEKMQAMMQQDLKRVFKYEVKLEKRMMPIWKLVAKPGAVAKLKTKGAAQFATEGTHSTGYTMLNWPPRYLIGGISFYITEKYPNQPFIDETGLQTYFDFTLDADMTDMESIRKALHLQGMDLVSAKKEMTVIVIRDPQH